MNYLMILLSVFVLSCEPPQPGAMREVAGDDKIYSSDKNGFSDEGLSDKEVKIKAHFCGSFTNSSLFSRCFDLLSAPIPSEAKLAFCESFKNENLRLECAQIVRVQYFSQNTLANCRVIKDEVEKLACLTGLDEEEDRVISEDNFQGEEDDNEVEVIEEQPVANDQEELVKVDGFYSQWSNWGKCSKKCNSGFQKRHRTCFPPQNGGRACQGAASEIRVCNVHKCEKSLPEVVDGYFTQWRPWGICNRKCGGGFQTRYRTCIDPKNGGRPCMGASVERRKCNIHKCPSTSFEPSDQVLTKDFSQDVVTIEEVLIKKDGYLTQWSQWATCSKHCGGGSQSRSRQCVQPENGGLPCSGSRFEQRSCNTHACPLKEEAPITVVDHNENQCTSIDKQAIKLTIHTKGTGPVVIDNNDFNSIKSLQKRDCTYTVWAKMSFLKLFISSGTFRINQMYGDASSGVSTGEFQVHKVNQVAGQMGILYFDSDFYPNPYAKKNYSARLVEGKVYYKLLSVGSSRIERLLQNEAQFQVDMYCEARECEDSQEEVVDPIVEAPVETQCQSLQKLALKLSDDELFNMGLNKELGKCYIQDTRKSTRAFCDYYVKTAVKGSYGHTGWPKNPYSGDSTGCIKAPYMPKRMSVCWPGNTSSMCTNDHIKNSAETLRDAIKNCACNE